MSIDPEKLISQWWSNSFTPLPADSEDWIEKSYSDSKEFWEGIFSLHQKSKRTPLQSQLNSQYDFYHDAILRHMPSNELAYTTVEKERTENWTYKQLHRCVNFHVRKWSKHDLQPGQLVVLVLSPGIEFLIALLTTLRLGLTFSFLPPQSPWLGKKQLERMLSRLKPQLLITEQGREYALKDIPEVTIDPKGQDEENHQPISFPYKAASLVQISLSLYRQEALALVPLDAHTMYLHALRDGLIALNLRENLSWAAPLSCPIRTEPCSLIMTLLAGARKVHVPDEAILNDPQILKDEKLHLIGVSAPLQQLWSRTAVMPTRYLQACYKNPLEINYQSWKNFAQLNKLEKTPAFQLLMDNSIGGISLLSTPHPDNLDFRLKPNLGTAWSLDDVTGKPLKSTCGYGLFNLHLSCSDNNITSNLSLVQVDKRCSLSGTVKPSRDGATFPLSELEEIINRLSFVEACMLHPILKAGQPASRHFVLLVFVNPMKQSVTTEDKSVWSQEISRQLIDQLGSGSLPDQIEYYPLLPKIRHQQIDRNWCAHQFSDGLLAQKMERPLYKFLHILKKLSLGAAKIPLSAEV